MSHNGLIGGYLDIKISSKSRRGLTPWKAWQRQWCEIRRLDGIDNGVELKLKSSEDGNVLNCVVLPRCATICRTESRTKHYAFGVFNLGRTQKPILFLSGVSETDSQEWMFSIRKMLSIASYIPVGESTFRVSLVDNSHSRSAGLIGMYGVLQVGTQELVISDPCTGNPKVSWKWYQFHQFHLQVPMQPIDDKKIIVMHTSGDFPAGPGQLYFYCKLGSKLLHHLVARGQLPKISPGLICKRFSRSEGDLCCALSNVDSCTTDSPTCFRSQAGSEDSGVRVSVSSDESEFTTKSKDTTRIELSLITKTPGGSETEDSLQDLVNLVDQSWRTVLPRNESGISLASGVYEEIPDDHESRLANPRHFSHVYESPLELILESESSHVPPPLPPRRLEFLVENETNEVCLPPTYFIFARKKHRSNTMPAKDLSKISQTFTAESDYVVMSPRKTSENVASKTSVSESFYMPMLPILHVKNKIESCYMSMSLKRT